MTTDPQHVLREHFGFSDFRPGQRDVIDHLVAGRSAAAVFPTGGGKSLCYQLPALMLGGGVTLVVSPLIALMKDQIDALAQRGIAAQRLDSSLTADGYRDAMNQVRGGRLRLLYVAPERFNNERFREAIRQTRVSLFAVDEAHCISEWGHNFRPDYLKLAGFAKHCGAERILALTATATPKVLDDICRNLEIAPQCAVRTGFYRPNLKLLMTPVEDHERDAKLLSLMRKREAGPTIVYCTTQRTSQEVAERLQRARFDAKFYHAGMKPEDRAAVQEWFLASDTGIVCATIAFGMGIDKADIRYVYHYNLPKSLENFAQEIGRAGRDGRPSTCQTLVCLDDLSTLENFVYGDTPTAEAVGSFIREVFAAEGAGGQGDDFDVSQYDLSRDHDLKPLVTRTLLTYLELEGYLEGGTPFYSTFRFKPLMASKDILAKFEGERRQFLAALLKQARKAKTWFDLNADLAAGILRCPRERIVAALDYLGQQGMLEVTAQGVRLRYKRLKMPENLGALAADLHRRTVEREKAEIHRLNQVVALSEPDACQVATMCSHFGETRPDRCGHCTWCLRDHGDKAKPAPRRAADIDDALWRQALALRREHPALLDDPQVFARLLCGLTSPALTRAKLTKNPLFGRLGHVPFQRVVQRASAPREPSG